MDGNSARVTGCVLSSHPQRAGRIVDEPMGSEPRRPWVSARPRDRIFAYETAPVGLVTGASPTASASRVQSPRRHDRARTLRDCRPSLAYRRAH